MVLPIHFIRETFLFEMSLFLYIFPVYIGGGGDMEIITLKNEERRSVLGQVSEDVNLETLDSLRPEIDKMKDLLLEVEGLGLAMPQVGLLYRCFIMRKGSKIETVINPKIVKKGKVLAVHKEGCLSVPGKELEITRPRKIDVEYYNEEGKFKKGRFVDLRSCVFQHELDHLNGRLILDRVG